MKQRYIFVAAVLLMFGVTGVFARQQTKLRLSESKGCLQSLPSIATSTKLTVTIRMVNVAVSSHRLRYRQR